MLAVAGAGRAPGRPPPRRRGRGGRGVDVGAGSRTSGSALAILNPRSRRSPAARQRGSSGARPPSADLVAAHQAQLGRKSDGRDAGGSCPRPPRCSTGPDGRGAAVPVRTARGRPAASVAGIARGAGYGARSRATIRGDQRRPHIPTDGRGRCGRYRVGAVRQPEAVASYPESVPVQERVVLERDGVARPRRRPRGAGGRAGRRPPGPPPGRGRSTRSTTSCSPTTRSVPPSCGAGPRATAWCWPGATPTPVDDADVVAKRPLDRVASTRCWSATAGRPGELRLLRHARVGDGLPAGRGRDPAPGVPAPPRPGRHRRGRRVAPDRLLALRRLPVLHRARPAAEHPLPRAPTTGPPSSSRPACTPAWTSTSTRSGSRRWSPSELVADCFELARDIRVLDMRASPYDLTDAGLRAGPRRDAGGQAEYVAAQRDFAERGAPLRQRLDRRVRAATSDGLLTRMLCERSRRRPARWVRWHRWQCRPSEGPPSSRASER